MAEESTPNQQKSPSQFLIRAGKLEIDLHAKTAEVDGARVHLTAKEYAILELLALRKGTLVTRDTLFKSLYDGSTEPEQKIIDVFISKLRKKLREASRGEKFIDTIGRRGYALRQEILGD
jgi:two-component system cell cycle response regulator CtrA